MSQQTKFLTTPILKLLYQIARKDKPRKKVYSVSCGKMSDEKYLEVTKQCQSLNIKL